MTEGRITDWLVDEGQRVSVGEEILEVETDKIAGAMESTDTGLLRRRVAQPGEVYPVKALLGVLADESVAESEIEAFIDSYELPADAEDADGEDAGSIYQTTEVAGVRVRYAQTGSGDGRVLLIHGFGGDLDNWLFNMESLAERHTVYALDLPGHGQSSKQLPGSSLTDLCVFVVGFMDRLDLASAHLVGHSLGGAIALRLALERPERVDSLSLIASAGLGAEINGPYLRGFVEAGSRRELKPVVQELFADPQLVTRQMLDDLLKFKRMDGTHEALDALRCALFDDGLQQETAGGEIGRLSMPVQIIWGERDRVIPVSHAEDLPENVHVHRLADAGHMVQMENANEVNRLLKSFVG